MAITTQTVKIDLNTGKTIPVVYAHQNDTNRAIQFQVFNNGEAFNLSGYTVKFGYVSPKKNGQYITINGEGMASGITNLNLVSVTLPETYTSISGTGLLTMIISGSGASIRPVNIRFEVQSSSDGDDVVSGSTDLPDALQQIADAWYDENIHDWLNENLGSIFTEEEFLAEIDNWLDDHPEATTTVQDGSITVEKLNDEVKSSIRQATVNTSIFPIRPYASLARPTGWLSPQGIAYANGSIYISYTSTNNEDALIVQYNATTLAIVETLEVEDGGHGKMCYNAKDNHLLVYPMWHSGENLAYYVFDIPLDLSSYDKINTTDCVVNGNSYDGELYLQVNGSYRLKKYTGNFASLENTNLYVPVDTVGNVTHSQGFYVNNDGVYHVMSDPSSLLVGNGSNSSVVLVRNIMNPYYPLHEPEGLCDFTEGQLLLSNDKFDGTYTVNLWRCDVKKGSVFTTDRVSPVDTHILYVNNTRPTIHSYGTQDNPFHSIEEALYYMDSMKYQKGYSWRINIVEGTYGQVYIRTQVMFNANSEDVYLPNLVIRCGTLSLNTCSKLKALSIDAIASRIHMHQVPSSASATVSAQHSIITCGSNAYGTFTDLANSIVRLANESNWTRSATSGTIIVGSGTITPTPFEST